MPPPTSPTMAPSPRKRRRKRDDPQSCLTNSEEYDSDEASPTSYAEVERFQGKVVYNLDGKAYIIDSENELSLQMSDSSIKDVSQSNNPKIHSFRVISSRDATMNSSSSTQSSVAASVSLTAPSADSSPCTTPSLEQQADDKSPEKRDSSQQRQQKPILMCFICKLSFGNIKLFSSHANTEHKLNLSESEKMLLCREYSSAIIQKNSDENSQISFLEPLADAAAKTALSSAPFDISKNNLNDSVNDNNDNNNNSNNNHDDGTENDDGMDLSADKTDINKDAQDEHQPRLTPKSLSSLTGRSSPVPPPALNVLQRLTGGDFNKFLNSSADLSQLTSLLEQHKTLNEFLAQQQNQQQRLTCPEHVDAPNLNDIDCKNCEFLNINQLNSPLTLKSPLKGSFGQHQTESNASSTSSKTSSPITSSVTPNSALQLHQNLQQQSNLNTSPSFTIGACPDHMNGRPIGVDCARCEILLNSARLNSGVQISTRNSCKTLKCPQCNWHYKYQETLEIHMREKHPDGESACGYCLAGAAHPRLARGESYTCGYKPYRCEICNYSTTTKGNLSIHMQSDKHLNNVQELSSTQNLSVAPPPEIRTSQPPSQPAPVSAPSTPLPQQCKPKPKPSFRCEPCSYETPNARNYRIHETSEKHTHNLAVVQCNIKRLQSQMDSFLQQTHSGMKGMGQMVPSLDQAQVGLGSAPGHLPGAALADLAYNQALLIQLLHQNSVGLTNANGPAFMSLLQQQQQQQAQSNQQSQLHYQQLNGTNNQDIDQGLNPETLEPPFEQDFNPIYHFSCLICSNFSTNDLEELNNHINEDRSRLSFPQEFIVVVNNNNYTCRLCCYKTHLKANCQLHCKTDKHLQRVNFANHIKQGGLRNEYKFEYVINSTTTNNNYNITQLKCNCCDYYTNSIQKLNCHIQNVRHESMKTKFNQLVQLFKEVKFETIDGQDNNKALQCQLCNFKTNSILDMVKHNKSLRHIQIEQIYCLQRRCETLESMDVGDVYQLVDDLDSSCSDFTKDEEKASLSPSSRGTPQAKSTPKIPENDFSALRASTPLNLLKMVPFEQLQQLAASLPSSQTILKCNQCDHLTENKIEMEQHFDQNHPNNPECNSIVLPSMAALMAAAQMNYEPKMDQIKNDEKSDDLTDKMLDEAEKAKQNCDADVMTIEPDIDGVIINNSSRSSSAVSMLEGEDKISTGAMRTTPQSQHMQKSSPFSSSSVMNDDYSIMCPLCQESFTERKALEQHVMCIHSVNADGLNRLLQLVDTSHWLNNKKSPERSASTGGISGGDFECLVCSDTLKNLNDLLMHATDHQHFTITGLNQFGCLLKSCHLKFSTETQVQQHFRSAHLNIVISERHVYKYRCPMCPLAFKTEEKLNTHFMYHTMRDATKCNICNRNFRSTTSLQRHIEQVHGTPTPDLNKSTELTDDERMQTPHEDVMSNDDDQEVSEFDGQNDHANEESSAKRFKAMKRSDKVTNYSLEKYHDPNRPYKCDDCFESFTQANILTVHKNSVSHLHRVKQKQKETHSGSSTPALATSPNQVGDFDRRSVDFDRKSIDYDMEIASVGGDSNKRKLSSDNDYDSPKKRFKCDICKVAYAQGSTLDIHMRSVGHQAKANRIMQQQQQIQQGSSASTSTNAVDLQQQLPSNNGNLSPKLANNQMYKTLLENFGFDMVKQFNDIGKLGQGDLMNLAAIAGKPPHGLPQTPKKNGNADDKKDEKFLCRHCKQTFANVFVLKAHCEEIHGEKMSLEMLDKDHDGEALDFSQTKAEAIENLQLADPMKLFNPEMLQQKSAEQKFDPAMLAQRLMEQQFLSQFPQISQSLQNLSSGSMPMNTLEMLNLMQFHHFMSLNFMNLAPPLIFGGAQQGGNLLSPGQASANPNLPTSKSGDSNSPSNPPVAPTLSLLQQQQQQQQHNSNSQMQNQACGSQKRARTRITDEQLKILRSHFDINNSPSEESILDMSKKANLPQKVVKHWFRNTLFKERQRNKDSPYNFANPPSTTLNLEEYERTGQAKVTPVAEAKVVLPVAVASPSAALLLQQHKLEQQKLQEQQQFFQQQAAQAFTLNQQSQQNFPDLRPISQPSSTTSNERDESFIKSEPMDEMMSEMDGKNEGMEYEMERFRQQQQQAQNFFLNSYETKSESGSSDILSRPQTPNSLYNNINDVINQQIESIPINNISGASNMNQMGPPKKFQLNKIFDKSYESNSSSSNSSTSSGKRANRTRFTDYQIKVLQEFFENNSYPKDSDLEYLSKLLLLSPRVIVVWFQNARQKQRKIYENQPNSTNTPYDATDEKKSACINYTCKKCNLIFQRYYELIRHQKNHCFKEENNKKSAKAQIAAAQIAQSLSSEDSNSSLEINHANNLLGNNLLHPVTSTTKSQQNLAQSLDAVATSKTPPIAATKMNLNHPVNLNTTSSGTHPNIMQPLDFHQQSAHNLQCHSQQSFEADPPLELHQSYKPQPQQQQQPQQQIQQQQQEHNLLGSLGMQGGNQSLHNPYNTEQMQEFLLQKFSTQDFDLLTKNYDFFLQYYKTNCPSDQQMDEKHLTMDFLSQFYHLNEFKKKLNGSEMELDENASADEMHNDNDEVVALDDKEEIDFSIQNASTDASKGKMSISSYNSNKRLRTTILPEQLNYLYECYQKESNPSRKQLEEISKKVNLKKRVVQVWYQNSRARERKGQFRQNMQIINKKCPYCSAIFKVKSALESHLQTKHIDKQMINIDAIPEISFAPKESPFGGQIPSASDLGNVSLAQPMNVDFWKAKMLQQPQTSQFFAGSRKRSEFSESEISFTDSNNDELPDEDYDMDNFNDDSNHAEDFQSAVAPSGETNKSKRHRTHVNRVQKSILRKIFEDVKSPSMIDCENIGREIGLFKRVVQVWFQNARANYKKCHKISTNELKHLPERNPSECQYCPNYNPLIAKTFQSHALSQSHIQSVHSYVMKNESHPDEDDDDDCQESETKAPKNEQPNYHAFDRDMSTENREDNFQTYTNCHPQKSLLVGDMHWID